MYKQVSTMPSINSHIVVSVQRNQNGKLSIRTYHIHIGSRSYTRLAKHLLKQAQIAQSKGQI